MRHLKTGTYAHSFEMAEQTYLSNCRILGKEHPDTLASMGTLASCYSDMGDYKKAVELGEEE